MSPACSVRRARHSSVPALSVVVTVFALVATAAAPASAQIYAWRDSAGHLVLSDRPTDPSARTYAVAATSDVLVTRPAPPHRSALYDDVIDRYARSYAVRPELVRAVIQAESAFNPGARSAKGAMGLMQLMPATALEYGVSNPWDPRENIGGGVAYLKALLTRYGNREEIALAAYNAGPGAVAKYGGMVPPYAETRSYVRRIQASVRPPGPPPFHMYRTVQVMHGREVIRYSNRPNQVARDPSVSR